MKRSAVNLVFNMNGKNLFLSALFIVTAVSFFPIVNFPLAPFDEALILIGAERVLKGQIPSKDFFTMYPPGQFYTLAAFFKVFGTSVIIERVYDIIIKSLISFFVFLNIRVVSSNKIALAGWAMSIIWITLSSFPAYPVYPSVLLTFISIYFLLLHMKQDKIYFVVLSALFIVGAILFRHDLGGPAAVISILVLLLRKKMKVQVWTPLISYTVTGVMAGLPVLLYFYLNSSIDIMINDLIIFPMTVFSGHHDFPYPPLSRDTLSFYLFPGVMLLGVISFFIFIKLKRDDTTAYGTLLISCIGIAFFNGVRVRSDLIHLLPVALTGILLAPILLYALPRGLISGKWQYRAVCTLFIIIFGIALYKPFSNKKIYRHMSYILNVVNPDIERAKYSYITLDLKNTVAYIKNITSKNEYIYVGVKNHDQFIFNDAIIYFLVERNYATRYHELNPGYTNSLKVQEEMVNELKDRAVRMVVLTPRFRYEPNLSNIDVKINLLDNYISANYELVKKFGIYEIWTKKL